MPMIQPEFSWKKKVLANYLHNFEGKTRFASVFITPVSGLGKIRQDVKQRSHTQVIAKYHICSKLNILFPHPLQFLTLIRGDQHM